MNVSVNWFCQVFFFFFLSQSFVSAISGSIKTKVVFFFLLTYLSICERPFLGSVQTFKNVLALF